MAKNNPPGDGHRIGAVKQRSQTVAPSGHYVKRDTETGSVGELGVLLSRAAEIGINVDAVTYIGHEQEGRPTVIDRQRLGIAFGLPSGFNHRF